MLTEKGFLMNLNSNYLVFGQDWEEGLVHGMINFRYCEIMLSKYFGKPTDGSAYDNLYLEHRFGDGEQGFHRGHK